MDIDKNEYIWVEKYRPKQVKDCILPYYTNQKVQQILENQDLQNMLFYGSAGTGKTTLAMALCHELGLEYILINGSREGRLIDTVRNTVTHFANTMSITGGNKVKVVIYDEFDNSTSDVQMAIRGLMEEVSVNCRFIFTGNYVTKIIEPIISRVSTIDFSIPSSEQPGIMARMMDRCIDILDNENIPYNKKYLSQFIINIFPDFRKIINELQAYSANGKIDEGILEYSTTRYETLVQHIINKDFKGCIQWTVMNSYDSSIYSLLLKELKNHVKTNEWLEIILQADESQYRHSFATDPDITLWSFCINVMGIL